MATGATSAKRRTAEASPPLRVVRTVTPRQHHLEVVAEAASDKQSLRFSQCRSLGHSWKHRGRIEEGEGWHPPYEARWNGVGFLSVCTNCHTQRVKWVARSGASAPNSYRYPDGYQRKGEQKLSHQEWRATWVVTLLGED